MPDGGVPHQARQPPAIVELCADALASGPALMVSAGRLAAERAWLTSARTWAAALPGEVPAGLAEAGLADAGAGAEPRVR